MVGNNVKIIDCSCNGKIKLESERHPDQSAVERRPGKV